MITCRGSVPFPPNADSRPIRALATNLHQLAQGLTQGSQQLTATAGTATQTWVGSAAQSYVQHTRRRAATVASVGRALGRAAPVLQTFATAIDTTSAAYSAGAIAEHAARCSGPFAACGVPAAIAQQQAALLALQAAGMTCAGALLAIEAEVAAAQFAGVDRSTLDTLKTSAAAIWDSVVDLVEAGDADAALTALADTAEVTAAAAAILAGRATSPVRPAPQVRLDAQRRADLVELGHGLQHGKDRIKPVVLGLEGVAHGLEHGAHEASQVVRRRNGTVYTRWTAAGRGASTGLTQQQAARVAATAGRWMRPLPAVAAAVDGGAQYLTDQADVALTTQQRVNRAGAATVLSGGGAWAGAVAGAQLGAAGGFAVGAGFAGIGAVPGSIAGGVVGAIGGGLVGSGVGKWAKEQLFAWNPAGAFR